MHHGLKILIVFQQNKIKKAALYYTKRSCFKGDKIIFNLKRKINLHKKCNTFYEKVNSSYYSIGVYKCKCM